MRLAADLHCHTIASEHAYSTLQELIGAAKDKDLELIAITDHGIKVPGAPTCIYFWNLKVIPEEIQGIRVLKGVEANIIDFDGNIDMPIEILQRLDVVIAAFHDLCLKPESAADNTKAAIAAIKNPYVDILGHPDNPIFPIDIDEVVAAAKEYGKLIELNNNSFFVREGSGENTIKLAEAAKKYNTKLVCSSDAHISFEVGRFDIVSKVIQEVGVPEELIINTSKEKVLNFIKDRKRE